MTALRLPLWFSLSLVVLFASSVLTLSWVQARIIARSGWRALQIASYRQTRELYWDNLSRLERWLIWPGIVCFFLIVLVGVASLLWQRLAAS